MAVLGHGGSVHLRPNSHKQQAAGFSTVPLQIASGRSLMQNKCLLLMENDRGRVRARLDSSLILEFLYSERVFF